MAAEIPGVHRRRKILLFQKVSADHTKIVIMKDAKSTVMYGVMQENVDMEDMTTAVSECPTYICSATMVGAGMADETLGVQGEMVLMNNIVKETRIANMKAAILVGRLAATLECVSIE